MTKRLIVCADGTWNSADAASSDGDGLTNVVRISNAVAEVDAMGTPQRCLYHDGVGVDRSWLRRVVGGAFGVGLSANVKHCYAWLADSYAPGDELFLFGFSRGAFTARSLAGLIRKCGILRPEHRDRVDDAYELYRDRSKPPRAPEATAFRATYSSPDPTRIKCIAVWDTVGSLGIPTSGLLGWYLRDRYAFHDVALNSWTENAFHALAIDERRKPFAPTLWRMTDADLAGAVGGPGTQRIEQVWFAGVHSNVGGGYPDARLSGLALAWIADRAASCGLAFRGDFRPTPEPDCCGELYDSMTPFYRVFGEYLRPVVADERNERGEPLRTFESVHESAWQRASRFKPPYDPPNVRHLPRA